MNLLFLKFDIVHQLKAGESGLESLSEECGLLCMKNRFWGLSIPVCFQPFWISCVSFLKVTLHSWHFAPFHRDHPHASKTHGSCLQPHFPYLNFLAFPSRFPENLWKNPRKNDAVHPGQLYHSTRRGVLAIFQLFPFAPREGGGSWCPSVSMPVSSVGEVGWQQQGILQDLFDVFFVG